MTPHRKRALEHSGKRGERARQDPPVETADLRGAEAAVDLVVALAGEDLEGGE